MQMSIVTADIVNIMAGNSMNTADATLVLKKVIAANHPQAPHPEKPIACRTVRRNCAPKMKKKAIKLNELSDRKALYAGRNQQT